MKKIIIVLISALCLIGLVGCSSTETVKPANSDEKVVKEVIVSLDDEGNVYVPNDDLGGADEIVYKLEDGTEVTIVSEEDLTVTGEHKAEVTYVKDGREVKHEVKVLSDTKENLVANNPTEESKPADSTPVETTPSGELKWGDPGYGDVEINGKVYGFDDLGDMDWDTSITWADAMYGEGNYIIEEGIQGYNLIYVNYVDRMTCEEIFKLQQGRRGNTGFISFNKRENMEAARACGA